MLRFSHLNRIKIAQCARENISEDSASEFVDMGDASPLYRSVYSNVCGILLLIILPVDIPFDVIGQFELHRGL